MKNWRRRTDNLWKQIVANSHVSAGWRKWTFNIFLVYFAFVAIYLLFNGRWWAAELVSPVPWYLFSTVWIVSLVVSIKWRNVSLLILVVVSLPFHLSMMDFGLGRVVALENEVSLLNWNTEYWHEGSSVEEFYQYISSQGADVIHLQEAFARGEEGVVEYIDVVSELSLALGDEYQVIQFGELVSATTLPIINQQTSYEGTFLRLDLQTSSGVISFYNVHVPVHINLGLFRNPSVLLSDIQQKFERRKNVVESLLAELRSNPLPKVISGDFNAQTSMPIIRPFLREYQDAFKQTRVGIPATINLFGLKAWRIDYVFGDKQVRFGSYTELDPAKLSDHWGIVVKLDLAD